MPSYAYVHIGSGTGTPLTLLVSLDEPYGVANVDLGPFVRVRKVVPPPAPWSAAACRRFDATAAASLRTPERTVVNTTSGEVGEA